MTRNYWCLLHLQCCPYIENVNKKPFSLYLFVKKKKQLLLVSLVIIHNKKTLIVYITFILYLLWLNFNSLVELNLTGKAILIRI